MADKVFTLEDIQVTKQGQTAEPSNTATYVLDDLDNFSRHEIPGARRPRTGAGKGIASNISLGIDRALGRTPNIAGDALVYFGKIIGKAGGKNLGDRMFSVGRRIQESNNSVMRKRFPEEDLGKVEKFAQDLGGGVTSLATALGLSAFMGPRAAGVSFGVTMTLDSFTESLKKGKSFKESLAISGALGIVEGTLAFVGLDRLIKVSGGPIKRAIKSAVTESIQEFSQSGLGEAIRATTGLRKFEGLKTVQDIFTQAVYEGALGAILGGAVSVPITIAQRQNIEDAVVKSGVERKDAKKFADRVMQDGMDVVLTEVEKVEEGLRSQKGKVAVKHVDAREKATPEQESAFIKEVTRRKEARKKIDKTGELLDTALEKEIEKGRIKKDKLEVAEFELDIIESTAKELAGSIKRKGSNVDIQEELAGVPNQFINNKSGRGVDEVMQEFNNLRVMSEFENVSDFIDFLKNIPVSRKRIREQIAGLKPQLVKKKETTVLREKISNIKRGFRKGKIVGREQVLQTQKELESILDASNLDPKDTLKFRALIKEISGAADPVKALQKKIGQFDDRIQELEQLAAKRKEIRRFKELTKNKDIKKMRPEFQKPIQSIIDQFDPKKISERKLKDLRKLAEFIEKEEGNQIPQQRLNELKRLEQKSLRDLSAEEIQSINDAINHFIKLNTLKNKLILKGKLKEFKEVEEQSVENIEKRFGELDGSIDGLDSFQKEAGPSWWKRITSFVGIDSYNAELVTEILDGETDGVIKEVLYREIDRGVNEQLAFQFAAEDYIRSRIKGIDILKWSVVFQKKKKNIEQVTFKTSSGKELRMTKGERLALFLHSLNDNSARHLQEGGFNFKGTPSVDPIILTTEDFANIKDSLSAEELKVAETIGGYLNTVQKDAINKVSVDLLGHEVAREPNYFPILVNLLDVRKDLVLKTGNFAQVTLEGLGIFKERQSASNAILLEDVFLATYKSVHQTSAYVGLAKPLRNAKALLGSNDFKRALNKAGKPEYLRMLNRYISKVEGVSINLDNVDRLTNKLINQMDLSVLGLNPFVMLKQPASYFGAATEISWKHLAQGFKTKLTESERAEMSKWSPQLRDRLDGNVTRELGEVAEVGRPLKFFTGKTANSQKIMDGIRAFDALTVGSIWRSVKLEIADKHPDLQGDAFFEKVAERAWEVTRLTQPTYNVKDRSIIGMSDNQLVRFTTKYTSQRNKNWMMYRRGAERYNRSHKTPKDKSALSATLFTVGFLSPIYIQLVDMMRNLVLDREKEEPLQYQVFVGWLKNNFGSIYFLGSGFDSWVSKMERSTFSGFDVNEPVTDTFNEFVNLFVEGANAIRFAVSGEKYKRGRKEGEKKWKTSLTNFTVDSIDFAGRIFGKPIAFWRKLANAQLKRLTGENKKDKITGKKSKLNFR